MIWKGFIMKLLLILLPGLLSCLATLFAQDSNPSFNQDVEKYVTNIMAAYEIPGVAIAVVKDGQIYYSKGFGVRNIESKEPVTESTIFHMASVSKPFVATAVMQLVEAGKVDLEKPLVSYLPYFKIADERYRDITVKQMLTHTSGMPDVLDYEWGKSEDPDGALTRYVLSLRNEKLIAAPGEKYAYSNMAYEVLGNLVEKVSGMPFEAYMQKNILNPLAMKHSNFLFDESYRRLYCDGHIRLLDVEVSPTYPYNPKHAPSSTLHSNVTDMCHWAIANLNRGQYQNQRILKATSYNLLWKPYAPAYDNYKIGLSWFLSDQNGEMKVHHGGGDLGFATHFSMKPRKMAAVVVLANHDYAPVWAISDAVWAMLEGGEAQMPKIPVLIPLSKVLIDKDVQTAIEKYEDLKKNHGGEYNFNEIQINIVGYNLLQAGRINDAIEIFKLNVKAFPESFNVYDSLAEAYMNSGEKELAILNYQKSLLINPENENGKKMLEKLQQQIK
jgi:CubicO group peptidase (beta-lactamase class C family)